MKQHRGLAAMSPERRKLIAARGQAALRRRGQAHVYTPDEGKAARAKQLGTSCGDSEAERLESQEEGHHNG